MLLHLTTGAQRQSACFELDFRSFQSQHKACGNGKAIWFRSEHPNERIKRLRALSALPKQQRLQLFLRHVPIQQVSANLDVGKESNDNNSLAILKSVKKARVINVEPLVERGAANKRRKLRCGLCYELSFSSPTQLADHLVGKRHYDLFPRRESLAPCPYCGLETTKQALYKHIRDVQCPSAFRVPVPASERRTVTQQQLDQDPRYVPILTERVEGGVIKIRPLHPQHTFETALVCTEAFEISVDPPRFDMMLSELRWHALNYQLDPSPVVSQRVDFQRKDFIQPEPVTDVVKEAPSAFGISNLFGAQERAAEKEAARRRIADSWGVWVWLIAELIPDDATQLEEGRDSVVVGATALMFHDRLSALEKISLFDPPLSPAALNLDLFSSRRPPEHLNYKHAIFIWWTAVHVLHRRKGIAGLLLAACESIGASAGFWTFFLQADLRQRDDRPGVLPWPPKEYQAAVGAYKKAGYTEVSEGDELEKREDEAFESKKCCLLMHKTFEGFFT